MADVLEQRLDFHDQYFPHNTPASIAINTPVQASFVDLTGEITVQSACVNNFDWALIAMLQLSDQDLPHSNVSSPQQQQQQPQNSRQQFNEIGATAFHNSVQHSSMLQPSPPFVEPSSNYIAITNHTTTQTLPYCFPSTTLPNTTQSITLDNGNVGTSYSSHNAYMGNSNQQQQQQHHHMISGYNFNPNHCLNQREIYQTSIPSSHHQKSIQRSVNSTLPISIAPNLFMQSYNQTSNGPTVMVPLFDQPTVFTTKPTTVPTTISINSPTSESSSTSPKQTYSYGGPPKSYYSRLPLYDRPYKCDQCPQSFNRNHDLKRHKRIHLAVKPFPCQYCEKQFSRKDALKRHILVKGCNNSSKRSTSPNGNKNAVKSTTNSSTSTKTIESYGDSGGDPIKAEPASDSNGYGRSI